MSVPKIAFSFWEGPQFTYMHYVTIKSFSKYHPDFSIVIYRSIEDIPSDSRSDRVPKEGQGTESLVMWKTGEHRQTYTNLYDITLLQDISNVTFKYIDISKEIGYDKPLSPVWKSDIVRILKLYEHGGFYIDFDTLFINRINESLLNLSHEVGFNTYSGVINNAFIVAVPKSNIIHYILTKILYNLKNSISSEYQQFGPTLITKLILNTSYEKYVYFIPNVMTCPYLWNEMDKLFYSNIKQYTNDTFCIHWYNGDSVTRKYVSSFTIETIDRTKNVFEGLLSTVL